jgi:hypothetical protein
MQIFEKCCVERGIPFDPGLCEYLVTEALSRRKVTLRGCQPRDLINQALALAEYRDEPRQLTAELLEAACDSYFADEEQGVTRAV